MHRKAPFAGAESSKQHRVREQLDEAFRGSNW